MKTCVYNRINDCSIHVIKVMKYNFSCKNDHKLLINLLHSLVYLQTTYTKCPPNNGIAYTKFR